MERVRIGVDIGGPTTPSRWPWSSLQYALSEHGVAIDPATLAVDAEATRAARRTRA